MAVMAERYEGFTDASGNQWVNYGTHACLAHQYDIDRLRVFVDCLRFLCKPARKPIVTFREVGEGLAALCKPRSESMFNGPEYLANVGSVLLPERTEPAPVNALELRLVERLDRHMLLLRNLGPNFAMREGDFRECGL